MINDKVIDLVYSIQMLDPSAVIIIQGDHGIFASYCKDKDNLYKILNAYYFPDRDYSLLYQKITPVNSFRVIFNKYFNAEMKLLEDITDKS